MQTKIQRIHLLDSFRFFAILLVICFHYFSRFEKGNVYPYGNAYADFFLFKYGFLGVQFFFMISGFVIFMTLEKCQTFSGFLLKRFIRLYPALLLCTLITFLAVPLLDAGNQQPFFHRPLSNLASSLTFIDPFLWELVFPDNTGFIDGVYWSLLVEVKFYIIVGALFFIKKDRALELWTCFICGVAALLLVITFAKDQHLLKNSYEYVADLIIESFLMRAYLLYFTSGIFFFTLYSNKKLTKTVLLGLGCSSIYFLNLMTGMEIGFFVFFTLLFLLFIYRPLSLKAMQVPFISKIGLISYPLYLVHQNLGVLLIHKLPKWFNVVGSFMIAVYVIVLMMLLAYVIDRYFDVPCQRILSYLFFKKQKAGDMNRTWNKPIYITRRFSQLYVSAIKNKIR